MRRAAASYPEPSYKGAKNDWCSTPPSGKHSHGPTYGFALGVVVTGSFEVRGGRLGRRQDAPRDRPGRFART
jgi:hypothetical protein